MNIATFRSKYLVIVPDEDLFLVNRKTVMVGDTAKFVSIGYQVQSNTNTFIELEPSPF